MSLLVTGASGFIGSHLLKALNLNSAASCLSLRNPGWPKTLASHQPSILVHLAGFAHSRGSEEEIRRVNVGKTQALAGEAINQGVKRFIFLSSIQAVAENSKDQGEIMKHAHTAPLGPYGRSKLDAEQLLRRLSIKSRMEVVIIRPPMVYGPGAKANFRNLLHLVDREIPLPLSALDSNRRSFVGVSNLIDLILLCLEHPAAENQTFHVSDDDDISTAELLRRMGKALGKPVRNLPIPAGVLKTSLKLAGKKEWVDKLCGDLRVDVERTKRVLGWKPKVTMEKELEWTAHWWRTRKK